MHMSRSLIAALALLLLCAGVAAADHRPGHGAPGSEAITISATEPVVWGRSTVITGGLRGSNDPGVVVRLDADAYPFSDTAFEPLATTLTDSRGNYRFVTQPVLNTRYRVVAETAPPATSSAALVRVRIRVTRTVSTTRPRRGALVRFRGTACPDHDGRIAYIQRLSSTGSFRTVARARLGDAGETCSRYVRRVRVRRDGTYRVRVLSRDADHASGVSRRITLRTR